MFDDQQGAFFCVILLVILLGRAWVLCTVRLLYFYGLFFFFVVFCLLFVVVACEGTKEERTEIRSKWKNICLFIYLFFRPMSLPGRDIFLLSRHGPVYGADDGFDFERVFWTKKRAVYCRGVQL